MECYGGAGGTAKAQKKKQLNGGKKRVNKSLILTSWINGGAARPEQQKRENSRGVYRNYQNLIHASKKRDEMMSYLQSETVDQSMQQIFFMHDDDDRQALRATLRSCLVCNFDVDVKWKETKNN